MNALLEVQFVPYRRISPFAYEVLNSARTGYYQVEMLNSVAIACTCPAGSYGKSCTHRRIAEQAESMCTQNAAPASCSYCGRMCRAIREVAICPRCAGA